MHSGKSWKGSQQKGDKLIEEREGPVSGDIIREDSGPQALLWLSWRGWEAGNSWAKGQGAAGTAQHLRAWTSESDLSSGSATDSGILVTTSKCYASVSSFLQWQ